MNPSQKVQVHPWKLRLLAGKTTMNEDVLHIFTWGFSNVILVFRGVQYSWTWLSFGIVEYTWRYVSNCVLFCLGFVFEASHRWPEIFFTKVFTPCLSNTFDGTANTPQAISQLDIPFRQGSLEELVPCNLGKCSHLRKSCFFFFFWSSHASFWGGKTLIVFASWKNSMFFSFFFCWHIFKSTCKQFIHEWWSKNWIVCCFPSTSWFMMDNIRFTREKISPWYPKQPFFHDAWLIFYWMIPKAFELGKMVGNHQFSIDSVYVHVWIAIVSIFLSLLLPLTLPNQE